MKKVFILLSPNLPEKHAVRTSEPPTKIGTYYTRQEAEAAKENLANFLREDHRPLTAKNLLIIEGEE